MSPSSFGQVGDGPAVRPGQKDRTGYPSDVSSPWLSPASSVGNLPIHFFFLPSPLSRLF